MRCDARTRKGKRCKRKSWWRFPIFGTKGEKGEYGYEAVPTGREVCLCDMHVDSLEKLKKRGKRMRL